MKRDSPQNDTTADRSSQHSLRRALGLRISLAVVVGNVIGSGIFLKPGNIAAACGDFWLIISVWVFGGLLCILGALCFSELATMLPHAGGLYVYLREAYGRPVAFLFGWTEFLLSRPAAIGALAVAFIGSFSLAVGWQMSATVQVLLSALLIASMAWVNIIGVIWGGRLQLLVTAIKVVFLALVAASPLLAMAWSGPTIEVANYSSTIKPQQVGLAAQLGAVLLAVMWAYNGWHGITPLAEEVRNPQRNLPLALLGGVGILIMLYVAANVAYHGVLSMEELAAAGDHGAERMLEKLAGQAGLAAMSVVIMCSTFGAINTNFLQAPRIAFAMGRDGVFFRALGTVHANYRTPVVAILAKALMATLLVLVVALSKYLVRNLQADQLQYQISQRVVASLQDDSVFSLLTNFVIFTMSIFYLLAVLAVIVLRVRRPDLDRPYKTLGYPLVPLAFSGVYVWFLCQIYLSQPVESLTGIALIAMGVPVYLAFRMKNGKA